MGQAGRTRRRSAQRWADDRGARRAQPAAAREPGAARRARDTIKSRGLVRDGDRLGAVTAFQFVNAHQAIYGVASFLYQAASWTMVRRVGAKVEFHCEELFPRMGFIVTSLAASSRAVVRFYNKRGMAEQWIKEGKQAVAMTWVSCDRFSAQEARLVL